jgi:hypothetical protein
MSTALLSLLHQMTKPLLAVTGFLVRRRDLVSQTESSAVGHSLLVCEPVAVLDAGGFLTCESIFDRLAFE